MKKNLFLIVILFTAFSVTSQISSSTIVGKVLDKQTNQPVVYATVMLKNLNRLLAIFLGLQGFFLYYIHDKLFDEKNIIYYVTLLISVTIIIIALNTNFNSGEKKKCIDWKFLDNHKIISFLLIKMYFCIFILFIKNKIYLKYCLYLIITLLFSYLIKPIKNSPSMWCLTSALVTPLYYYLN